MKPTLFTLGMATALLGAPAFAWGQTKSPRPELLATAPAFGEGEHWGTIPPSRPLPYGYVWNEYRGAEIEHPLYAPRHHGHVARTATSPCLMSQVCCWFDKLFARKCAVASPAPCQGHAGQGHVSTELPPLPTLAPAPVPAPRSFVEDTFVEPAPMPIPSVPIVDRPVPPKPQVQPQPQLGPADVAPIMPPVDLIPTRPLVSDPPAEPAPTETSPAKLAPAKPAPVDPLPVAPQVVRPTIDEPKTDAPKIDEPKPLVSERAPVVELAPDFMVDGRPTNTAPQNVIPPGVLVPRNTIPKTTPPLNILPGRK